MHKTKFCQGISDISDSYQAFLIDQWGVLHNGVEPYDGAIDCLRELKARNKVVIILSNSGKRASVKPETLAGLGILPDLYTTLVTSGEIAYQGMRRPEGGFLPEARQSLLPHVPQ